MNNRLWVILQYLKSYGESRRDPLEDRSPYLISPNLMEELIKAVQKEMDMNLESLKGKSK